MSKEVVKASVPPKVRKKQEKVEVKPLDLNAFDDFTEAMQRPIRIGALGIGKKNT